MTTVTSFVHERSDAFAICISTLCHHQGRHEVFCDVVFSDTWSDEADDRTTFGCMVGPEGASLVTAGLRWPDSTFFGRRLSREDALLHHRLDDFWLVVDHVLVNEPAVVDHFYGPGAKFETT